jgi:hypothetical protein
VFVFRYIFCSNFKLLFDVKINDFIEIYLPQLLEVGVLYLFTANGFEEVSKSFVDKYNKFISNPISKI